MKINVIIEDFGNYWSRGAAIKRQLSQLLGKEINMNDVIEIRKVGGKWKIVYESKN